MAIDRTDIPRTVTASWRLALSVLVFAVFIGLLFFGAAGRLDLPWGWVFMGTYAAALLATWFVVRDPALFAERTQIREGVKRWDLVLARVPAAGTAAVLIAAGLETGRYGRSELFPLGLHLAGMALMLADYGLTAWAMRSNTFFSSVVRIQSERGHRAVSGGPYSLVRHPGYLSMGTMGFGAALLLGSPWALVPAAFQAAAVVLRTALEDRTLQAELPGYAEYSRRVRWRLVPGVW